MHDVWQQAAENLEKVLSERDFTTWIKPISYSNHDDKTVYLSVPTLFFKEWIEEHYRQMLMGAFSVTAGKKYLIDLVVTENNIDIETYQP